MGLIIYFSTVIGREFIMGMEVGRDTVSIAGGDGAEVEMEHMEGGWVWIGSRWMLWAGTR